MKFTTLFLLLFCLISCNEDAERSEAERIIDKAIEKAGGDRYTNAEITFSFRGTKYTSKRNEGQYELSRTITDSTSTTYYDVLTNDGFKRFFEERQLSLSDSLTGVYTESVNAVHYFVHLPYGLNDPAVQKELIGEDTINNQPYYEIEVTFEQQGGGADHEDIYMYWVNQETYTIDYLAYRFFVNDGGIRFRKAVNSRNVQGIRFVDYENYKASDPSTPLENLDELFQKGQLQKVSQIENEILEVKVSGK